MTCKICMRIYVCDCICIYIMYLTAYNSLSLYVISFVHGKMDASTSEIATRMNTAAVPLLHLAVTLPSGAAAASSTSEEERDPREVAASVRPLVP